jgi:hypothetical protein
VLRRITNFGNGALVYPSYVRSTADFLTFFGVVEYMINGTAGPPAVPLDVRIG